MKQTKIIMGMPITVEITDANANAKSINKIFMYFKYIDNKFSTYKKTSEITKINTGKINKKNLSADMKTVFRLAKKTRKETNGYFNINKKNKIDPSGLVKGWAINNAAKIILSDGFKNFYIDAGGDIQTRGLNAKGQNWKVGIRNPFSKNEIVKVITAKNKGVATSGIYERGKHIFNPKNKYRKADEIVSLTVIGPNIYEADRFATAAFAMGREGIRFIENLKGFDGYMINKNGIATMTSGFSAYQQN